MAPIFSQREKIIGTLDCVHLGTGLAHLAHVEQLTVVGMGRGYSQTDTSSQPLAKALPTLTEHTKAYCRHEPHTWASNSEPGTIADAC